MKNLNSFPQNLTKKLTWLWLTLLILPFVITAFIQFSCFPMITSGKLRRVCYTKTHITDVLTNFHTHGNTLYDTARDAVLNNDQELLDELDINLERPRVDYDSQRLEQIISFGDEPIVTPPCTNPPCKNPCISTPCGEKPPCTNPPCDGITNPPPPPCTSKLVRNISAGILTGLAIGGLVLTVGSGGLLAPIAFGAGLLGGTATTWLVEQLSQCPYPQ